MKGLNGIVVISIWCFALAAGQKHKDIADTAAQIMDGLDTNRDGRISYYEMIEVAGEEHAAGFRDADVDKDMHLSKKEFQTLLSSANNAQTDQLVENSEAEVAQSIMDGLDLDRDRKLSMYELMDHVKENKHMQASFSGWQQGFKEADVNQDGHLTVKELTSLLKNLDRGDQQQLVEESEDEIAASVLEGFDSDRNGHISMRELLNHVGDSKDLHAAFKGWEQGFMEADVNRDGQLSVKELSSLLQRVSRKDQQQLVEESEDEVAASVMEGFDLDRNGQISRQELLAHVGDDKELHAAFKGWQQGFTEADVNKDGQLSVKELSSLLQRVSRKDQHKLVEESEVGVAQSILDGFDSNRNGKISMRELLDHVGDSKELHATFKGWKQGFMEADADKDGQLSVSELSSLLQHVSRETQHELVEDSEDEIAASVMDGFDSNRNGHISMRELLDHVGDSKDLHAAFKGWQQGFMEADVNRDGQLSLKELSSLLQRVSRKDQQQLVEESEDEVAASVMDGFDLDRNGQISRQELLAHVGDDTELHAAFKGWQQGFTEADVNKDGQLSLKELSSLLQRVSRKDQQHLVAESEDEVAASVMDGFDSNRNGKLSMRELLDHVGDNKELNAAFEGWQQGFREADVDKDGQLSIKELSALLQRVSRKDQHELVDHSEMEIASSVMDGFDTDKNGQISLQELLDHTHADKNEVQAAFKGWQQGFVEADTDKNGQLNLKELASLLHRVSRKEQHKLVEESEVSVAASVMDGFDSDGNGKISMRELLNRIGDDKEVHAAFKGWQQGFQEADIDKDGQLNGKELSTLLDRVSRQDQQDLVEESEMSVAATVLGGLDADRDGRLSLFELLDHVEKSGQAPKGWREGFKQADADGDMHLSIEELASLFKYVSRKDQHELVEESEVSMAASLFQTIDKDRDGMITFQEMNAHLPQSVKSWRQGFHDADANKDGKLNLKELTTVIKSLTKPEQHQAVFDTAAQTVNILKGFDSNRDGKLSMAELARHSGTIRESFGFGEWRQGFVKSDVDGDNHLDFDELRSLLETVATPKHDEM
jgi:Ca2+-binding EF-hand superfamily protein